MKPIKIKIRDYQSIDSLDMELSGFTCITGPTNIGKSAIVRAISSAILNKSVVGAVRKGKKFCTVDIDGLKWEKGERVGRYWVPGENDEAGNAKPRDSIGQGQTEVTELLGFRSVKVGDKYINPWLATQFNPIFLMEDSGPAVTDFISDIAHLKSLQNAIVHCTRTRQRLLTSVKDKEDDVVRLSAKEEALSGIDNLLQAEKDLMAQLASLEEYSKVIASLRALIDSTESEKRKIAILSEYSSIKVPKRPADPGEALMSAARLWSSMEEAAVSILAVKGVTKVPVPEKADAGAVEEMRSLSRFLAVPALRASVSVLSSVSSVAVPEKPDGDSAGLRKTAELLLSLSAARKAVSSLSNDLPEIPDKTDTDVLSLRTAAGILALIAEARASVSSHEARLSSVSESLSEVEKELSKIPTCPTCKQVVAPSHAH